MMSPSMQWNQKISSNQWMHPHHHHHQQQPCQSTLLCSVKFLTGINLFTYYSTIISSSINIGTSRTDTFDVRVMNFRTTTLIPSTTRGVPSYLHCEKIVAILYSHPHLFKHAYLDICITCIGNVSHDGMHGSMHGYVLAVYDGYDDG